MSICIFHEMNKPKQARTPGFRLSVVDLLVMTAGFTITLWLRNAAFPLWWIVPAALGHFFLFCNVFLVWRKLELIWAAAFVCLVGIHVALGHMGWLSPLILQTPVTLVVLWLQLRSPWYHGIFARQINPRLDDFLAGRLT